MEPCGEIRGTVKDKENGNSLSGASVTLLLEDKEVKSTFTEENGSFLLDKIQPGSYTLLIQKLYYKELTYTVTLSGSETLVILDDILLEPEENGIHGTVVDAKTGEVISGATVSVSNTALAKNYASITGADGTFVIEIEGYNAVTWTVEITAEGYQKTSKSVSTWIGIVGLVYDASVSGCTNSMYIWGNTLPFGGIVGMAYGGSISGCSSKGVIFVSQDYAAGQTLVGRVVGGQSDSSIYSNSGACIVYNYSKNAEVSGIPNVGYNVAYPLS